MHRSEVKGIWFDSARSWLSRAGGKAMLARVDARVSDAHRGILLDPVVSAWYPEAALAELLASLRVERTDGSPEAFMQVIEDVTLHGVGRFFKLVLAVASAKFVLRKVPVLWDRMRRGAGHVEVETKPDGVRLRYRAFPWFHDENYRLMTVATLRGVCRAAGAKHPTVTIVDWTSDTLDVDVVV